MTATIIYFDNSATTKPYKAVIETYATVSETYFANPSSFHSLGKQAEVLLDQGREQIAQLLKITKKELVFTSGGTEGNNLAIKGTAFSHKNRGRHLITTKIEHASTFETFHELEKQGFEVTYLDVDNDGVVSLAQLNEAIREDTILVSIIHVNNETGSIQPIKEIGELLKKYPKLYFHVDHVQGVSKVPLSFKECQLDLCTISGHKFHGPKGTGLLYIRQGVKLFPLLSGGRQENRFRAGTENLPGIIGMAKALRMSLERYTTSIAHLKQLHDTLFTELNNIDEVVVNSPLHGALHIVNFSIPGIKPEIIIQALAEKEIYVSTKSACSSKLAEPSRVLLAMGLEEKLAESAIRVSFSFDNELGEVNRFIQALRVILMQLKEVMR